MYDEQLYEAYGYQLTESDAVIRKAEHYAQANPDDDNAWRSLLFTALRYDKHIRAFLGSNSYGRVIHVFARKSETPIPSEYPTREEVLIDLYATNHFAKSKQPLLIVALSTGRNRLEGIGLDKYLREVPQGLPKFQIV